MRNQVGLLVCLAIVFAGCGKSDSEKFADAYCPEMAKCCAQAGAAGDGKACRQMVDLAASFGSYDNKAGDACLAEMRAEVSAGTFCTEGNTIAACNSVFGTGGTGNKQVGEACEFDDDCALASEGKVACDFDAKTCVALREVGAACTSTLDCVRSAFCDYDQDLCTARLSAGGDCSIGGSGACVDGYYCTSDTSQCAAQKANGAACSTFSECRSSNCANGTCQSNGLDTWGC